MEILRGVVRSISKSAHAVGVVTCEIGNRPVQISMSSVPVIDDGDEIIVAGKTKFGKLDACAFRNLRNGTSGHWDYNVAGFAAFIPVLGIFTVIAFVVPFLCILPLIVFGIAVWLALDRIRIYTAYNEIILQPATTIEHK